MNRATQSALGPIWFTNHHKSSLRSSTPSNEGLTLHQRANGSWKTFYTTRGYIFDTTEIDGQPKSNANGTSLWYYDMGAEAIETHAWGAFPRGYATAVAYIDGRTLTYTRASLPMGSGVVSVLQSITDDSGRQVGFTYENDPLEAGSMRIVSATDPAGNVYGFRYGAKGQLTTFQYPDQTTRQYQYEVDGKPWLMTALIDETGSAYGRYSYDSQGRAVTTRTGTSGVQWSIDWTQAPQMNVTETFTSGQLFRSLSFTQPSVAQLHGPDGYEETLSSTQVNGVTLVASRVQPAGAGSASATVQYDRDSEGNITRQLDANGLQSCHAFVANRHAESTRVDGLAGGTTCGTVLASNATLPTGARKVSSLWHPVWRKQVRTAEPNRITTLVYNGQPDPTNGNAVASCAPSTALLPDGSAIVVLCKRVEQATTDANGALGFNAVAQPGVAARTWSWTYDAQGHVLTETDPLDRTTTNTYYADSTADHWTGDLKSSTNAAGHVTNYLRYSALGQVLEVVDANGLSTVYTYDVRSRLTSVVQADQTTSYTYWPTGLVKQVTQPDGSTVSYDYDDAHRLVAVADNLGNRIQYTLDQRGNRTNETVQDPNGTLQRSLGRVFDALSRTQKTMGGE
ncbi:RHS repeat protein [Roseateles sp. YR242]|uniref:RHS repeat protein n=1 Tax=Roseateles sp. YR242 TaxID=1855305 RepID=UPI0015A57C11|nr:RHS repeat protein [Roseateles sp. YR242]